MGTLKWILILLNGVRLCGVRYGLSGLTKVYTRDVSVRRKNDTGWILIRVGFVPSPVSC